MKVIPAPLRALGWRTGRRAVEAASAKLSLASYVPYFDYREQLDSKTTLARDPRTIRDKRGSTVSAEDIDLTLTLDGLADVAAGRDWRGLSMLEVGPKYGIHTLWLDEQLGPRQARLLRLRGRYAFPRGLDREAQGAARLGIRRPAQG